MRRRPSQQSASFPACTAATPEWSFQVRLCNDFSQSMRRFDRHDVDAIAMGSYSLDRAHSDFYADIFGLITGGPQLIDHRLWNRHTGNMSVHELSHLGIAQYENAGQHLYLERTHRFHET